MTTSNESNVPVAIRALENNRAKINSYPDVVAKAQTCNIGMFIWPAILSDHLVYFFVIKRINIRTACQLMST